MQPFPFTPWAWRDPSWLTDRDRAAEDVEREGAAGARPDTGVIGYHVEATDGGIGKVDEDDAEVPADCLMVDTGPWIFGRKVVLPVGTVHRVDHEERKVYVDRTKEQIKNAPEYDPGAPDRDDYRRRTGDYYTETYRIPPMM
ncbi:PRC-barrel domain containing protein [Saccharothrix sp. HUAS TT1]|uniref:PRC-barrel domain containing protein n=1 Tax=unclassified Saccharothrix TaxID=2593673 RepID=UPI00345C13D9